MPKITIDKKKCKGCLFCMNVCPKNLIRKNNTLNNYGINPVEFLDNGSCLGCNQCALICPDCCIEVFK